MALRFAIIKSAFLGYSSFAIPLVFLYIAVIYWIVQDKKEKRDLLIYEIFGILLLVTPVAANRIIAFRAEADGNWDVYGSLAVAAIVAAAAVDWITSQESKKAKLAIVICVVILCQIGINFQYTSENLGIRVKYGKLDASVLLETEKLTNTESSFGTEVNKTIEKWLEYEELR